MKNLITVKIALAFLMVSCTKQEVKTTLNDSFVVSAVSIATKIGLTQIKQPNQTVVANYLDSYAVSLRTITGTPTPEELTAIVNGFIPANIKAQYPELVTFAVPLIVTNYQALIEKYGNNTQETYHYLNLIATGIESGAACCISH